MSQLDNAFTCHGQSWADVCIVCAEEENKKHIQEGYDEGWVTEYEKEYDNE